MTIKSLTVNVMAPLLVGDPGNLDSPESQSAWRAFDKHLQEIKRYGVSAVSTDVWWGLIEPQEGVFNWSYYDKVAEHILAAGLKWIPIFSFHQCGGNIGDDVNVYLPRWIWTKLAKLLGGDENAAKYVSEQGNASNEYVSVWATKFILGRYKAVMQAFQHHYADKADHIAEINISLGPAGELRYPSYNAH
ncbi:MAG: family 14 glycosylhydrolase, partial [Candidatus Obscuribacterales bacterium]|nr:family 14 glycosylhydrolase [Candidatus Obscuribacterales bacterium]